MEEEESLRLVAIHSTWTKTVIECHSVSIPALSDSL